VTTTVIICTHNPREDYLRRTLEGLQRQSLARESWELLLIDNASKEPLAERWDLSWHPHGRHVREAALGLTEARRCGINHAQGRLVVFVDDDNILAENYLELAVELMDRHATLGAIGGCTDPEYETEPPAGFAKHASFIGIRQYDREAWTNQPHQGAITPIGAGLCVRREVTSYYLDQLANDPARALLDRAGNGLGGCGDYDLVYCATDLGMGYGVFPQLRLDHLIGSKRLGLGYLARLAESGARSSVLLRAVRAPESITMPAFRPHRTMLTWLKSLRHSPLDRAMARAWRRGWRVGCRDVCQAAKSSGR
jgi:glycosyltransferase involved in cell wall biosynthesis